MYASYNIALAALYNSRDSLRFKVEATNFESLEMKGITPEAPLLSLAFIVFEFVAGEAVSVVGASAD